jgi:hypothetical protein
MLPVDYVSRAILTLSLREEMLGRSVNLVNEKTMSLSLLLESLLSWANTSGFPLQKVPFETWWSQLNAIDDMKAMRIVLPAATQKAFPRNASGGAGFEMDLETSRLLHAEGMPRPPITPELLEGYIQQLAKAHGKVDRKTAPEMPQDQPETISVVEELLIDVWMEILGASQVGACDNFYDLGGRSLVALRIVSRINDYFRIELSVRTLLEFPVLREFARELLSISGRSAAEMEKIAEIGLTVRKMSPEQRKTALAVEFNSTPLLPAKSATV